MSPPPHHIENGFNVRFITVQYSQCTSAVWISCGCLPGPKTINTVYNKPQTAVLLRECSVPDVLPVDSLKERVALYFIHTQRPNPVLCICTISETHTHTHSVRLTGIVWIVSLLSWCVSAGPHSSWLSLVFHTDREVCHQNVITA